MAKDDAMDKISKLIEEKIGAAFEGRARAEKEEKDPWAKLEGIVDRSVAKHLEALGKVTEDEGDKKKSSVEGDAPKLGILGF